MNNSKTAKVIEELNQLIEDQYEEGVTQEEFEQFEIRRLELESQLPDL